MTQRETNESEARRGRWRVGLLLLTPLAVLLVAAAALAAEGAAPESMPAKHISDTVMMWGFIAAAAATGIAALGAAFAVSHVGAAALGAMGERPELSGRALIFLGLAEGIAIYGLIVSIMILGRLG
jgi:V/A-type H+-transporting ATPase subunit K